MAGGLRTTTILAADIVSSTPLERAIGDDVWLRLVKDLHGLARQTAEAGGGILLGTAGDGIWAGFDASIDGVTAGVRLMQAVVRLRRSLNLEHPLQIRVGITTGDVLWNETETDCQGLARNMASRLESAADPGMILCAGVVPFLAGAANRHNFVYEGPKTLAGFDDKVETWSVPWDEPTQVAAGMGLPAELGAASTDDFVGREPELSRLRRVWEKTLLGQGQVLAVAGEAGLGKTTLCHQAGLLARRDGGVVLYGRVDEQVGHPYQPFIEMIRDYVSRAPEIQTSLGPVASELSLLVPELKTILHSPDPPQRDAITQRHMLFDAFARWIRELSNLHPLFLVIDDLTWADEQTLGLARHLGRRITDVSAMIIWAYRPAEANDYFKAARTDMARQRNFSDLPLSTLSEFDVVDLLRSWSGLNVDPRQIHEHTGGNPFFLRELLRELGSQGEEALVAEGHDRQAFRAPRAVKDLVATRLRRLQEGTKAVLETAAVSGAAWSSEVVSQVLNLDEPSLAGALSEAEAAAMIRPAPSDRDTGGWDFTHAIFRDAIYDETPRARIAYLHRSLAIVLDRRIAEGHGVHSPADLAYHYAAGGRDPGKSIHYAVLAAGEAQAKFAFDAAVQYFRTALDLFATLPESEADKGTRARLLLGLGAAQRRSGQPTVINDLTADGVAEFDTLLLSSQLAAEAGDAKTCAAAILAGSRGMFTATGQEVEVRLSAIRKAIDMHGPEPTPLLASLLATLSVEMTFSGQIEEMDELSDRAVEMARTMSESAYATSNDPRTLQPLIEALSLRLVTLWRTSKVFERLEIAIELEDLCKIFDRPQATLNAATFGAQVAMEAGDFETADRRLDTIGNIASELRQPTVLGYARLRQAMRASLRADFPESERLAKEAYQYAEEAGQPDARAFYMGQIYNLRFHQGGLGDIVEELEEVAEAYPGIVAFWTALALTATDLEDKPLARRALDRVYGVNGTGVPDDLNWMATTAFAVPAAAYVGDVALCRRLMHELEPWRELFVDNASTCFGSVERYIALALEGMGETEEAKRRFRRAAEIHERLETWALLARTELEWGELLIRERTEADLSEAEVHLHRAQDLGISYGLGTISRRCDAGLTTIQEALRLRSYVGPDGA